MSKNIRLVGFMSSVVHGPAYASWCCHALQSLLEGHIYSQKSLLTVLFFFFKGKEREVQHLPGCADTLTPMHQDEPDWLCRKDANTEL